MKTPKRRHLSATEGCRLPARRAAEVRARHDDLIARAALRRMFPFG